MSDKELKTLTLSEFMQGPLSSIEEDIYALIKRHGRGVSFVELRNQIDGFEGDLEMYLPGYDNIVVWSGISSEAADAITRLLKNRMIESVPTTWFVYVFDGAALDLPILKPKRRFGNPKKRSWLPLTFKLSDKDVRAH